MKIEKGAMLIFQADSAEHYMMIIKMKKTLAGHMKLRTSLHQGGKWIRKSYDIINREDGGRRDQFTCFG